MRMFLISVAIVVLVGGVSPVIAQDRGHLGGGGRIGGPSSRSTPTPAENGRNAIGERLFREHHDVPASSSAPASRAATSVGGNRTLNENSGRPDSGRRGNDARPRGSNDRPNFNRPRANGSNNAMRDNRGPRRDFGSARNYHQNFRAPRRFRAPSYHRPPGYFARQWRWGQTLPLAFWVRDYWLNDFYDYDLPPPPYGAVWVRVGDDALLIDQDSGEIITVYYGVFY